MRQHTDERPYKCKLCPMAFRQKATLEKHTYAHSGTRPFNCIFSGCDKGYYSRDYLRQHLFKVHQYTGDVRVEKKKADVEPADTLSSFSAEDTLKDIGDLSELEELGCSDVAKEVSAGVGFEGFCLSEGVVLPNGSVGFTVNAF